MEEPSLTSYDNVMLDGDESKMEAEEIPTLVFKVSHEAKLKELLHNINAIEIKLCSDATKEFIKLLRGDSGCELLCLYVRASANFSELLQAWKLRQGKPGMWYLFSLISAILSHPAGLYKLNDKERVGVSRAIDKFARLIIDEKMDDVYKELNSKEGKRQNAALTLMASIVRRGSGLASEVAKRFDFKLQSFPKLAEYKLKRGDKKRKHLTRKSFIGFAMSFLEVGKPGLLRWILQQKEMYSGVLRGLGDDENETVIYVLSTLRDRVLTRESLVPPGLRSVLFGNVVLEQLASVSGREGGEPAAELAHDVLVMVCTDPCNGLMPDLQSSSSPLKGNSKRLLGLMKKLKGNEVGYHRDLLMAILRGRPSLGSAYLQEFPYNVEDYASPSWLSNVSLAASLLSSIGSGFLFDFLDTQSYDLPSFNNADVRNILSCICPRPFGRSVINKGLLHSDFLVKHGTLRLLLEALKLLDSFLSALNNITCSSNQMVQSLASLKQEIQNEVQMLLPDPQVLLSILSLKSSAEKIHESNAKRKAESEYLKESGKIRKKPKTNFVIEDSDIVVAGVRSTAQIAPQQDSRGVAGTLTMEELKPEKDYMNVISKIWGFDVCPGPTMIPSNADSYFQSKLLHALRIYVRSMPTLLEGSFDFFVNLLSDPLALPTNLQCSLLSLLTEYIGFSTKSEIPNRTPSSMYKHMQPFINLLILSPVDEIKEQAYSLARAAMLSTGAFDRNIHEIGAWFLFLPRYTKTKGCIDRQGVDVLQSLSRSVISFLSDAVSTIGNNLFKYWATVEHHSNNLEGIKGASPNFSPMIICVLQKCVRLLSSESGTFSLPEKSMISLYVGNTLKYILQTQVDAVFLSSLIESILSEGLMGHCSVDNSEELLSEWMSLKNLLLCSRKASDQQSYCIFSIDQKPMPGFSSFKDIISEVKKFVNSGHGVEVTGIIKAFSSAMLCATPDELLKSFQQVITISQKFLGIPVSLLSSIMFSEQNFLASVSKLWPEVFFHGLEIADSMISSEVRQVNVHEMLCGVDFDATESAAAAFGSFLKQVPFHVLFPAIMRVGGPHLSEPSKLMNLLVAKLSELTSDCLVLNMRLVLFWLYQIQLLSRIEPVANLQQLSEICLILVKHVFSQLSVSKPAWSPEIVREITESVFCHPVVFASITCPFDCRKDFTEGNVGNSMENILALSRQRVHKVDGHVLDILSFTCDYLLSPCPDQCSILKVEDGANKRLMKLYNAMTQKLFSELQDKFDWLIRTKDILPIIPVFYALHTLTRFIFPFELLELVRWMFSRVDGKEKLGCISGNVSALSIVLCIAAGSFESLSTYLQQPITKRVTYDFLWQIEEKSFDINLIEEIYIKVCKSATDFNSELSNICLMKAIEAMYHEECVQHHSLHPLSMVLHRVMLRTPVEMISHCFNKTNRTKVRFLLILTRMSPLHLSVFGNILAGKLNKDLHKSNHMESHGFALSDVDFMMLLPVALSYLSSNIVKFKKQYHKHFTNIPAFYSGMLLNSFHNWKSFVSGNIFQEEYRELHPSSMEELLNVFYGSLLGKAITMLRYHFALSKDSLDQKKLLMIFNSLFTGTHNELIEDDVNKMKHNSVDQSLNLTNRIIAKISLCKLLLFPEDNQILSLAKEADGDLKNMSIDSGSNGEDSSKMRFLKVLVNTWQVIVKQLPSVCKVSRKGKSTISSSLCKHLELFILGTIRELSEKMIDGLIQFQSVPFLEQLMKSSLLYRFEDLATIKILQSIFKLLSQGKCSSVQYLQLLVAHSQFAPAIHSVSRPFDSSTGVFVRPMSGILRLVPMPRSGANVIDGKRNMVYKKQLEILKLLRTLIQFKPQSCISNFQKDNGINLGELYSLLLSSYGATLSDIDLEIYHLMREIELIDGSVCEIAKWDYLWGTAALKIRKERALELHTSDIMNDTESIQERRRSQFRDNLPLDPKLCAITALYFPYNRIVGDEPSSSEKPPADHIKNVYELHPFGGEDIQRYDPVFILRFSIHCLSMGYIEPAEFAGLGLLAVAFVSISSPDAGMRKLGYETLGRFKNALETCQRKKEVTRLRLLLTYVQNGIQEPWQKIPSVIAVFAAETSLLLLDPSQDHFPTISKFLTCSSSVNMKSIPLFQNFFSSSSVNFKKERLWILRLVYAGLNLEDDAYICIRNSILEMILSFYISSLSDNESKKLILLIVKRSVKLHKLACYLVEHCGLISWLSSLISISTEVLLGDEKRFFLTQLAGTVEVVNDILSSRNIVEWLQKFALEQLVELSCHLCKLLAGGMKLIQENVTLINSILQILVSTMKISQKREIFQPHFTLSLEGLYQLYQAVNMSNTVGYSANAELGLKAILMSTPSVVILHVHHEKLPSFLTWAVSTALKSNPKHMSLTRESDPDHTYSTEDSLLDEPLASKLLRWLTASVILSKLSWSHSNRIPKLSKISDAKNLESLIDIIDQGCKGINESRFDSEEILAATIYYLQQHLGVHCRVIPSVVSALSLLLFPNGSKFAGSDFTHVWRASLSSPLSRIHSPDEANPAWKWSYYQPWKDPSSELTDLEKIDELHACQILLLTFSNLLDKKSLDSNASSCQDGQISEVLKWEKTILETE